MLLTAQEFLSHITGQDVSAERAAAWEREQERKEFYDQINKELEDEDLILTDDPIIELDCPF